MNQRLPDSLVLNGIEIDLRAETLCRKGGARIALRPQSFAILRHLVANANRLVTKVELVEAVWHGLAVTDDSLVQCIHELRRALDDEGRDLLQTVTRRGYRLVLPPDYLPDPRGPSIAVLPFTSLGDESEPSYFADGLVEDVITSLSKVQGLLVIARNSSFASRSRQQDHRRVASELGVRYLLEGSVRRSGRRLRINGQLVDGETGACIWADRFDGEAEDVFELQDLLTERITGVIQPSLRRAEIARARRKRLESLDAYDLYLRALPHVHANAVAETDIALGLLTASLNLDPAFLPAQAYAAWCREQRYFRNGFDPADRAAALAHADAALAVNADDPLALSIAAFVRANLTRNYDDAIGVLDRALAMNGNSALAFGFSALISAHSERHDRAIAHACKALRLSPLDDPLNYHPYCALALAHLFAGEFEDAARHATLSIRANPGFSVVYCYLVASRVGLGDLAGGQEAAQRLLEIAPGFTVSAFARMDLFRPALTQVITDALHRVGMPEGAALT